MWDVIHTVAAGYPVTPDMSKQEKAAWANAYLAFFRSLIYVLPKTQWRSSAQYALEASPGKLDDETMLKINETKSPKRSLSKKLFQAHDAVRTLLGQSLSRGQYARWFDKYAGASIGSTNDKKNSDPVGVGLLAKELEVRADPMNVFLRERIPGYSNFRPHEKAKTRPAYLHEAAIWWWNKLAKRIPGDEAPSRRREIILTQFSRSYRRTRQKPGALVKNVWAMLPSRK